LEVGQDALGLASTFLVDVLFETFVSPLLLVTSVL